VSNIAAGLTISAVAARTGLSAAALRAWEQRFGFPHPERLEGGHRRYDEADVERISRVMAERDAGRSLEAAIGLVLREAPPGADEADTTVFAGLRRACPDLPVHVFQRQTMLALSQAIEDEALASGEHPHLFAAFQTRVAYQAAHERWDDLIDTAAATIVFADFPRARRRGTVFEVPIRAGTPLRREWSVVSDAPSAAAVLAGWERADGRFEAVWTVEPEAVRLATHVGRRLVAEQAPRLTLPPPPPPLVPTRYTAAVIRRATTITNRVVAHLDRA
jgi:MerR family transcriptional regulator, light-induced transcriptional regulator